MGRIKGGFRKNSAIDFDQDIKKSKKSMLVKSSSPPKLKKIGIISSLFVCGASNMDLEPIGRKYNIEIFPVPTPDKSPPRDFDDRSTDADSDRTQGGLSSSDIFLEAKSIHEYILDLIESSERIVPSGKGFHGSGFLENENGEKVGVWKPEERRGFTDHFRQKGLLLSEGVRDPLAVGEEAAYLLSERLGFTGFIPKTAFVTSQAKVVGGPDAKGSFQEFGGAFDLATKAVAARLDNPNKEPTEKELLLFQKMACLDFILGNLDRHAENWMVKTDDDGQITEIILIDNGPSIPRKYTTGGFDRITKLAAHNQYNWATFTSAEKVLSTEMTGFINGIDENSLDEVFECLDESHPKYLSESMKHGVKERLSLLKKAAGGSILVKDSVRGKEREFRLKDLFLFMDGKKSQHALTQGKVFWDPKLRGVFNHNRSRNIRKGRQVEHEG